MWGRYDLCQNMGMHLGFFLETGMRMDRIYPILGIDWTFSPKWKLNAVFPFNMSLEYSYNKCLTFALAGRTFSSRNRIQPTDYNNKCVCRYSNFGIEGLIRYEYGNFVANVHAGYTTGGRFRVADEHNHHPHNYDLDPAGYAGAELDLRF